jgi:hypothetical protein
VSGTASSIVLALLLSTAYAAAFHFLFGGSTRRLLLYIAISWFGFTIGHFLGQALGIEWLNLGPLYLLSASLGSWLALLGSRWLAGRNS